MPGAWDDFAAREPYFAVLTEPRFLRDRLDEAAEADFFRTGEEYVSELYGPHLGRLAQHLAPLTVLEYGCGVGRLLLPFSRRAEKVTGVDISTAMLATAREHLEREKTRNVELLTADAFENDARTFDLVNCFLVFQRLRRQEGLELLRKLAARVREGGVAVFHFPYRARVPRLVRVTRSARSRVPGVNAFANVLRGKPASTPLIESTTYDLGEVLAILREQHFEEPHIAFTHDGDLDGVLIFALKTWSPQSSALSAETPAEDSGLRTQDFVDVRKLIASTSIEELNRTAEGYFAGLEHWEHHLAKPFAAAADSPQLLISLGAVLQGLQLSPGMTVLEFGAGSGWLSRYLTQLGCRAILLDVSATALDIARELYARQPVIGERPEPRFLVYDGRRIDLPDASVDRILCFDAFHHAPNPDDVLREFGRVLKPRGVAAFAEPGPNHSKTPQSQYEMRTYGVVEADVDIHAIRAAARRFGFIDLKLAAFHVPPFHLSLAEYDDLLAGGETLGRWAEVTRIFMSDTRMFFLTKTGSEELDSRRTEGLHAEIEATPGPARAGEPVVVHVTVRNTGKAKWLPSDEAHGGVALGCHLLDDDGRLVAHEHGPRPALPFALEPGQEASFDASFPPLEAGRWILELDCVAEHVTWFAQAGSTPARLIVDVA